ncbi:MAG: hypothetical protein ACXVGM_17460 [Oryzihumus sp.]
MRTRRHLGAIALTLALPLGAVLTACGDDSSTPTAADPNPTGASTSAASPSPSVPGPQCSDVWVAGKQLPGGFQGCYEGAKRVKPDGRYCEFGKSLYTYDHRYFAVRNGTIMLASKGFAHDAKYQDTLRKCSG